MPKIAPLQLAYYTLDEILIVLVDLSQRVPGGIPVRVTTELREARPERKDLMHRVVVPSLGEVVEGGKVICWLKLVGEPVEMDSPLLTFETDKINVEIPAPVAGVVRAIFVAPGESAPVGTILALIGERDEPLPDPTSLPGQPLDGVQRCAEGKRNEKPSALAAFGWLSISCVLALLLIFQRLWPTASWPGTLLNGLLLVSLGVWIGVTIHKWRGKEKRCVR